MLYLSLAMFLSALSVPSSEHIRLDGDDSYPRVQVVSYTYWCPDGMVLMEVKQKQGSPPMVKKFSYGERAFDRTTRASVDQALAQLRTLESVSPRCLTGGGIRVLLIGLARNESALRQQIITVRVDKQRHVSVNAQSSAR
jgi:hypothetical protein